MKEESRDWLAYAEEDFAAGDRLQADFFRNAVWAYQQAAEKSIKALLIDLGIDFPKSHDLVALINLTTIEVDQPVRDACLKLVVWSCMDRLGDTPVQL